MLLSSNRTALAEVVIPCPFDEFALLFYNRNQFAQCPCVKTIAGRHSNRRYQPELGLVALSDGVHMHWLARASFVGVEEESKPSITEHHGRTQMIGRQYIGRVGMPTG